VSPQHAQSVVAVMLNDLVQQALPRIFAIRHKLDEGCVLTPFELEFLSEMLGHINQCQRQAPHDHMCQVVFTTVAHILIKVTNQAMENENKSEQAGKLNPA